MRVSRLAEPDRRQGKRALDTYRECRPGPHTIPTCFPPIKPVSPIWTPHRLRHGFIGYDIRSVPPGLGSESLPHYPRRWRRKLVNLSTETQQLCNSFGRRL